MKSYIWWLHLVAIDTEEEEEEHDKTTNMSKKILLDTFLQRLPQCVNRDFIDKVSQKKTSWCV